MIEVIDNYLFIIKANSKWWDLEHGLSAVVIDNDIRVSSANKNKLLSISTIVVLGVLW